jgi:hypothetical protein
VYGLVACMRVYLDGCQCRMVFVVLARFMHAGERPDGEGGSIDGISSGTLLTVVDHSCQLHLHSSAIDKTCTGFGILFRRTIYCRSCGVMR